MTKRQDICQVPSIVNYVVNVCSLGLLEYSPTVLGLFCHGIVYSMLPTTHA